MTPSTPSTPAYEATAQQSAELEAMRRMLDAARGTFSLSVAVCNSPALRDYLIARLRETYPAIAVVSVPADTADPFELVTSQVTDTQPDGLFVIDLERSLPSDAHDYPVLRSLNASRELWERHFRCPVVLWLPEYAATLVSTQARDFWRYRSHRFEFVSELATAKAGAQHEPTFDASAAANLPQDEKQFRIAELEQRLEDAKGTKNPTMAASVSEWMNELALLHRDLGNLGQAESYLETMREAAISTGAPHLAAIACSNLGAVKRIRGDLDGAEEMYRKALEINETLGRLGGIARNYAGLGTVLASREDLDGAEAMFQKALAIEKERDSRNGVAALYTNIGNMLRRRGDLSGAEGMFRKGMEIDHALGRLSSLAKQQVNLGLVLRDRGDLDGAESMFRRALEINEQLGNVEGIAHASRNLGGLAEIRGNLSAAREWWTKARESYAKLGNYETVEVIDGWIERIAQR